jgi:uncharacterized protein (DUF697 family)
VYQCRRSIEKLVTQKLIYFLFFEHTTAGDYAMEAATISEDAVENGDVCADSSVIISSAVKWSAAAGLIPVPYVDLVALGAVQFKMVRDLASLYSIKSDEKLIRSLVATTLGSLAPTVVSTSLVGSSLKLIPGYGTLLGSASVSGFSAAATYAIGKVFVRHFENGGTLKNFSAESIEDELKEEFSDASEKAGLKKNQSTPK